MICGGKSEKNFFLSGKSGELIKHLKMISKPDYLNWFGGG